MHRIPDISLLMQVLMSTWVQSSASELNEVLGQLPGGLHYAPERGPYYRASSIPVGAPFQLNPAGRVVIVRHIDGDVAVYDIHTLGNPEMRIQFRVEMYHGT